MCRIDVAKTEPLIDLGCGTGELIQGLSQVGFSQLSGLDLSTQMLELAKKKVPTLTPIHADLEQIPLENESIQTVVSNAALQWCNLYSAFQEAHRIMRTGGQLFANVFVSGTLAQWRRAFQSIGHEPRIHSLADVEKVRTSMTNTGFRDIQTSSHQESTKFTSVESMFDSIRKLGATNATASRKVPFGRQAYLSLKNHFQQQLDDRGWLELDFVWVEADAKK